MVKAHQLELQLRVDEKQIGGYVTPRKSASLWLVSVFAERP